MLKDLLANIASLPIGNLFITYLGLSYQPTSTSILGHIKFLVEKIILFL